MTAQSSEEKSASRRIRWYGLAAVIGVLFVAAATGFALWRNVLQPTVVYPPPRPPDPVRSKAVTTICASVTDAETGMMCPNVLVTLWRGRPAREERRTDGCGTISGVPLATGLTDAAGQVKLKAKLTTVIRSDHHGMIGQFELENVNVEVQVVGDAPQIFALRRLLGSSRVPATASVFVTIPWMNPRAAQHAAESSDRG
jgi:hypothetical protein